MFSFQKLRNILGKGQKKLLFVIFLYSILALLEIVGVGLIAQFISFISSDFQNYNFFELIDFFGLKDEVVIDIQISSYLLLLVFTLKFIFFVFITWFLARFIEKQKIDLRERLMSSYLYDSYTSFLKKNSADFIYLMETIVPQFAERILFAGLNAIGEIIITLTLLIFLFYIDPLIFTILAILFAFIAFIYDIFFKERAIFYGKQINMSSEKFIKTLKEASDGFKEIKTLKKEQVFLSELNKHTKVFAINNIKAVVISHIPRPLLETALVLFVVVSILSYVDSTESVALTSLSIFLIASIRLLPSINKIFGLIFELRKGVDSINKIDEAINKIQINPRKFSEKSNKVKINFQFQNVKLEKLKFKYPGSNNFSINNLSISISKGDAIGIFGPSGSGKTTLIDILIGLIKPQEGRILINDQESENLYESFVNSVAYIPQHIFLMDSSLAENICLDIKELDMNRLKESIALSKLEEVVKNLPQGIYTRIGERGITLSGGQRQRITIARAIYHRKNIMIFDESTSSLDSKTESEIMNEIYSLKGEHTSIIISHNFDSLKRCDKIYEISQGKVINSK